MAEDETAPVVLEYDADVFDVGDVLGGPTIADQTGDQTDGMGPL